MNLKQRKIKRLYDRNFQKKRRAENKGLKTIEFKIYCQKNPEKVNAQQILSRQIKNGQIKRSPCQVCGKIKNIQGHHQDYSKPLEIIWLCPIHHKEIHKNGEKFISLEIQKYQKKSMTKLTQEKIAELPELLKTKSRGEVARLWSVSAQNINYWVKQYEKRGVVIPKLKRSNLIDKIINEQKSDTAA